MATYIHVRPAVGTMVSVIQQNGRGIPYEVPMERNEFWDVRFPMLAAEGRASVRKRADGSYRIAVQPEAYAID